MDGGDDRRARVRAVLGGAAPKTHGKKPDLVVSGNNNVIIVVGDHQLDSVRDLVDAAAHRKPSQGGR